MVRTQLRYSGILETIRIRKEGFPIRIPFLVFIDRCPGAAGWARPSQPGDTTELVGALGGSVWAGVPPRWELGNLGVNTQFWGTLPLQARCLSRQGGAVPVFRRVLRVVTVPWARPGTAASLTCGPMSFPTEPTAWRC